MKITNIKFDQEIEFSKEVADAQELSRDLPNVFPIRTITILYKSKTGLGATYNEIVSPRHSIIVLPHLSVIKSKNDFHRDKHNTFAVHGKITTVDVLKYLNIGNGPHKLITTPQGLKKIITAVELFGRDAKSEYFLLMDECHKFVQDATYRTDMVNVMETFFEFKNKAMVSATPIPPSDPRFKAQGFRNIKLSANYDNKKIVKLIHAESIVNSLKEQIALSALDCFCIFFNSVKGIYNLIDQLKLNEDYNIFCSEESKDDLLYNNELNVSHELPPEGTGYKKYNFFTSSFFNGLDIKVGRPAEVIILSDYSYQSHTIIDPFTDTLQILGRSRDKKQSAIHINNAKRYPNPISEVEVLSDIDKSKYAYECLEGLRNSLVDPVIDKYLNQAMKAIQPYHNLLDADRNFSFFLRDNYIDDNRVMQYYKSPSALKTAYLSTGFYEIVEERASYEKSTLEELGRNSVRYSKQMNQMMTEFLLNLEEFEGTEVYYQQSEVIQKLSPLIYTAYHRLGLEKLKALNFSKKKIENELLMLDIAEKKNSFPLIDLINNKFKIDRAYLISDIKRKLQELYNTLGITCIAKSTDLNLYFHMKEYNKTIDGRSTRAYILQAHKFNSSKLVEHDV
jgi:hypothetical protein